MKVSLLILGMACFLPVAMSAQDDVYYIPSKEVRQITNSDGSVVASAPKKATKAAHYEATRDVDDYNRRSTVGSQSMDEYESDSTPLIESTFDEEEEVPYTYTKRIMRFYSPHPGVIVSSPYYWDICYSDAWDAYYDGWAVYVPSYSWWSYAYDPWYYNRWAWRTCWDYTWGWHDPWWSFSYWGWSRPIYWGWHRPYYGPHHGPGRFWAGGGWRRGGFDPGFGPHGGRTFAGRGMVGSRPGFGGRDNGPGMRPMGGRDGGRRLSGVFRSDRMSASARSNGRGGVNNNMGTYTPRANGGGGVSRMGRNGGYVGRQGNTRRDDAPSYGRNNDNRRNPNYTPNSSRSEQRNSYPSDMGRGSNSRSSSPSYGSGGVPSGSPSVGRSGGGMSRGGGGVSRGGGGVSRGGRR